MSSDNTKILYRIENKRKTLRTKWGSVLKETRLSDEKLSHIHHQDGEAHQEGSYKVCEFLNYLISDVGKLCLWAKSQQLCLIFKIKVCFIGSQPVPSFTYCSQLLPYHKETFLTSRNPILNQGHLFTICPFQKKFANPSSQVFYIKARHGLYRLRGGSSWVSLFFFPPGKLLRGVFLMC